LSTSAQSRSVETPSTEGSNSEGLSAAWVGLEATELAAHELHSVAFGHGGAYLETTHEDARE
jgi:hypothetical protein